MGPVKSSRGAKFNSNASNERSDIVKLYTNMVTIIQSMPEDVPKKVFCARYHGNMIYFEELFMHGDKYIREVNVSFKATTTVRLVKDYVLQIPKLLQWKEAVMIQCLKL